VHAHEDVIKVLAFPGILGESQHGCTTCRMLQVLLGCGDAIGRRKFDVAKFKEITLVGEI